MMETLLLLVFGYMIIRAVRHTDFVSRGKGAAYVFVLFGLVAVYGSYYICSHAFGSWPLLFPALSMGFMAVAAKADDDKALFRNLMVLAGWTAMIVFSCLRMYDPWHFLFVLSLPLFFMKRRIVAAVFVFAILSGGGFLMYLL
jgi:1,4-dihydroxy-2-naphthoate octaprenyltransferase